MPHICNGTCVDRSIKPVTTSTSIIGSISAHFKDTNHPEIKAIATRRCNSSLQAVTRMLQGQAMHLVVPFLFLYGYEGISSFIAIVGEKLRISVLIFSSCLTGCC
jgi:hypothetical protein